jgi:hypothetical protein
MATIYDYTPNFCDNAHAAWCRQEAERRYGGKIVRDEHDMLVVEGADGHRHTDAVLRALSMRDLRGRNKHEHL